MNFIMKKTNAMRILEKLNISYTTLSYDDDGEHALAKGAAEMTAQKLGVDPSGVFKTIVMRTDSKEVCVFLQSAIHEINLKKARAVSGAKEIAPVKSEELLALTGYVRGGCSPLGMKKQFRTFIDSGAMGHEKIHISAGVRGQQICLAPADLARACGAEVCDLVL
uniref:Cys-tRNA(Pro)/Cys-tRNA(Cys) deacylase n=1 Tax=uncultured Spirochaetaceae bacterium TaxID=201186 RepID=A0A650EPL0_9SPIO|nr:putative Cys-tRNA(Pro)/Cys-tRNA(Cys) deacylase YjdI [uncultured Spirochaetaceae bacterium]